MHAPRVARIGSIPPWNRLGALLLAALFLNAPSVAIAVSIDPGTLGPAMTATGCFHGGNCDICNSDCDGVDQNTANASVYTTALPGTNPFQHTAYSHIYTEFTVSPPSQGEGDWVTATAYYDVGWKGLWAIVGVLTGANTASMDLDFALQDVADLSRILLVEPVHESNPNGVGVDVAEIGGWTDTGHEQGSFTTQLRRGHTYRITYRLDLRTASFNNAYYVLNYRTAGFGAWWNELRVAVAPDPVELVAHVGARVDTLEYRLEHHGHEYLTGRGEGHNNTVATTSATIFFDDAGDTTANSNVGTEAADASPVSVILRSNYPNPARRSTVISFRLAAASPVTIRLFNAQGQLVTTLADRWMDAGEQRVPIDVGRLGAGVYFYRLTAGPFMESRRLVVK